MKIKALTRSKLVFSLETKVPCLKNRNWLPLGVHSEAESISRGFLLETLMEPNEPEVYREEQQIHELVKDE